MYPLFKIFKHKFVPCLDFAVGAPYERDPQAKTNDSYGAIYVYRGHSDIAKIKLSQKIASIDISLLASDDDDDNGEATTLQAFGYSLSGGLDMDANTYPDLVVGSLNSNAVLLLRTQPIVHLNAYLLNSEHLQEIDQKVKQCKKPKSNTDAFDTVCFSFEVCFEVKSGLKGSGSKQQLPLLNYTLVGDALLKRVYFSESGSSVQSGLLEIRTNARACHSFEVLINQDNADFLRPLKFKLDYQFVAAPGERSLDLAEIRDRPLVHEDGNSFEFEANFKKDCGADKKCVTDLSLRADFVDLITGEDGLPVLSFKESDSVTVALVLKNVGANAEPAYATQILVSFDERLDFIRKLEEEPSGFSCVLSSKSASGLLECRMTKEAFDIPFAANHQVRFNLTFSSQRLYRYANLSGKDEVRFDISAKTLSTDLDLSNNALRLVAKLKVFLI